MTSTNLILLHVTVIGVALSVSLAGHACARYVRRQRLYRQSTDDPFPINGARYRR